MADATYSVKLDEELKRKITSFVKESGVTGKEFFAKLIERYEMESREEKSENYTREMKELEGHLLRIRALYENLSEEFKIELEASRDESRKTLEEKGKIESELREEMKSLNERMKSLDDQVKKTKRENDELKKQLERATSTNKTNTDLISEYKEKISTLGSSISKLEAFGKENEKLKKGLEDTKKYIESLEKKRADLKAKIESLQSSLSNLRKSHGEELESLKARMDFEKQSAIAREKQVCQTKIENLMNVHLKKSEEFSETLNSLYAQIDKMRDEIAKLKARNDKEE